MSCIYWLIPDSPTPFNFYEASSRRSPNRIDAPGRHKRHCVMRYTNRLLLLLLLLQKAIGQTDVSL